MRKVVTSRTSPKRRVQESRHRKYQTLESPSSSQAHHLERPHALARVLLYIILLIVLFVVIATFSIPPSTTELPLDSLVEPDSISFLSTRCVNRGTSFYVCADLSRVGGSYAKASIAGGKDLALAEAYEEPSFTVCDEITGESGYRLVKAVLYGDSDEVLMDVGQGVLCEREERRSTPPSEERTQIIHKQFTATGTTKTGDATGSFVLDFEHEIVSCTLMGDWRTTINLKYGIGYGGTKDLPRYCHGAEGSFESVVSSTEQWTINDPSFYEWRAGYRSDPEPTLHPNTVLFLNTCDQTSALNRNFVQATASGIGTPSLSVDWTYHDQGAQPRVDIDMQVACRVRA